jgi:hypothetical protein
VDGYRQRLALWRVGWAAPRETGQQGEKSSRRRRGQDEKIGAGYRSQPKVADSWRTGSRH